MRRKNTSLLKVLYLATLEAAKKWTMPLIKSPDLPEKLLVIDGFRALVCQFKHFCFF